MGGIRTKVIRRSKVEHVIIAVNRHHDGLSPRAIGNTTPSPDVDDVDSLFQQPSWLPWETEISHRLIQGDINGGSACFPKQAAAAKVSEVSSLLGKAGTTGLGKAKDVFDRLGSSMTNMSSVGVTTGKGNKISILAFEAANTIVRGLKLMQSLSEDNIRHLKEVVLLSEGVQTLISRDTDELLRITAADKREELERFSRDVVRFGNHSKDSMWHDLDRYFRKIGSQVTQQKHFKKQAQTVMEQLMILVLSTAELCHELHLLERLEQDYQHKVNEGSSSAARRGHSLAILRAGIKNQEKRVSSLKKKSLWSKTFEEIVQKLVDIVHLLHLRIHEAFGSADDEPVEGSQRNHKKLGPAGISLHYATIITQISTLVSLSRSSSLPQNMRDNLYQGLPSSLKSALRSRLQLVELTIPQIKIEMEKTLQWLVPMASNTTKAHHRFGWVGEWANTEFEARWKHGRQTGVLRIETLHHADKAETEACIFKLVVWLHHLFSQTGAGTGAMPSSPVKAPSKKTNWLSTHKHSCSSPVFSVEDEEMPQDVSKNNSRLGMSKSQKCYDTGNLSTRLSKHHRLSKSCRDSLESKARKDSFPILFSRPIDFDIDRIKLLDAIDGVDTSKGSK